MTVSPEEFERHLDDALWRIRHIYTIRHEDGVRRQFVPNEEQEEVLHAIFVEGCSIIAIPKARQLGMSTLIAIVILDALLFSTDIECCLTDLNSKNAKHKLTKIVLYAFDGLPRWLRSRYTVYSRNVQQGEFSLGPVGLRATGENSDAKPYSTFMAGEKARGGTFQIYWFSEWQQVSAKRPQDSEEILTGGWPAGEQGTRIIETTWKGGQHGDCWNIVKDGLDELTGQPLAAEFRTKSTPRILFFPWWKKKAYREAGSPSLIRPETWTYFKLLEAELGIKFDHEQMLWYQIQHRRYGIFVKGEYPSTIHECWEAPIEGAIWAEAMDECKRAGRVCEVPHDAEAEVDTTWDLGAPQNTATCYWQHQAGRRNMIDHDGGLNLDLRDRLIRMKAKGYIYGNHYLPHDAASFEKDGVTFQRSFEQIASEIGLSGRVVPLKRAKNIWTGIVQFQTMLLSMWIDREKCKMWIDAAQLYRRKEDPTNKKKFLDEVVKDWTNHHCDAARYLAEADLLGHIPNSSNGVMTNCYFDSVVLSSMTQDCIAKPPTIWQVDNAGSNFIHVSARRAEDGWLRQWESPLIGRSYIVSLHNGALGVWRAAGYDAGSGTDNPTALVAACLPQKIINPTLLYEWAALASALYGGAPIAADVLSLPGSVQALRDLGAPVIARRQPDEKRLVGAASERQRHWGIELKPDVFGQGLNTLQTLIRDEQITIYCARTLHEMGGYRNSSASAPVLDPGAGDNWVKMTAMGVLFISQSAPNRAGSATGGRVGTSERGLQAYRQKQKARS